MLITPYQYFVALCLSLLCCSGVGAQQETAQLGKVRLSFTLDEQGEPVYSVTYGDQPVILPSRLGLKLKEEDSLFSRGFVLLGVERSAVDTMWQPVWGETKDIRDHYVQLTVHLRQGGSGAAVSSGSGAAGAGLARSGRRMDIV